MKEYYVSESFKSDFKCLNLFDDVFKESKPAMKKEVMSFFKKYLSEIDGVEFWKKCTAELPSSVR